jgi:hypothetical protein
MRENNYLLRERPLRDRLIRTAGSLPQAPLDLQDLDAGRRGVVLCVRQWSLLLVFSKESALSIVLRWQQRLNYIDITIHKPI